MVAFELPEDTVPEPKPDRRPLEPQPGSPHPSGGRDPVPRPPDLPPLPEIEEPPRPIVPKPDKV